jgi:hypothetical protein
MGKLKHEYPEWQTGSRLPLDRKYRNVRPRKGIGVIQNQNRPNAILASILASPTLDYFRRATTAAHITPFWCNQEKQSKSKAIQSKSKAKATTAIQHKPSTRTSRETIESIVVADDQLANDNQAATANNDEDAAKHIDIDTFGLGTIFDNTDSRTILFPVQFTPKPTSCWTRRAGNG